MTWAPGIDGPIAAPIYGEAGEDGALIIIGEEPGYRINLLPDLMVPELELFRVHPTEPKRIWAGDEPVWSTVFLLFADEAEARASALGARWLDGDEIAAA